MQGVADVHTAKLGRKVLPGGSAGLVPLPTTLGNRNPQTLSYLGQ